MEQPLISKKELLELTGISYGQLYRWKRKNLIPEDWFIRKSTFTGQETFFPRDRILARLDKIKGMKDDLSLDELADVFSPLLAEAGLSKDQIISRNIVTKEALRLYTEHRRMEQIDELGFRDILFVYVLDQLLCAGHISLDEGRQLLDMLAAHYGTFEGKSCELVFIRKLGVSVFMLLSDPAEAHFENGAKVVARMRMSACIEQLKLVI